MRFLTANISARTWYLVPGTCYCVLLTEPTCLSLQRNPPERTEPVCHILQNTLCAPVKLRTRTQKWDQKNNCLSKGCRPTATEKHPCGITNALLLLLCPLVLFTVGSFTQEGMASPGTVFKSPHPSTNFSLSFPLNNWISKGMLGDTDRRGKFHLRHGFIWRVIPPRSKTQTI